MPEGFRDLDTPSKQACAFSELIRLGSKDVVLGTGAHVVAEAKGAKNDAHRCAVRRRTLCVAGCANVLPDPTAPLFPNARGGRLSRDGTQYPTCQIRCHRPAPMPVIEE